MKVILPRVPTAQLWADYQRLGSLKKAGELHGISESAVCLRFKRAGLVVKVKPLVPTEQLWFAYQQLGSVIKVAHRFGMTHSNVVQRLHNAGYTLRRRGGRRAKP